MGQVSKQLIRPECRLWELINYCHHHQQQEELVYCLLDIIAKGPFPESSITDEFSEDVPPDKVATDLPTVCNK